MSRRDRPGPPDPPNPRNPPAGDAEDLRTLFQELPGETAPGEECPPPELLWAAARGELEAAETRRVILHTGRCPSCAEDWRIARRLGRDLDRISGRQAGAGGAVDAGRRSRAPRPSRWLSAAAAVIVTTLGAGLLLWQQGDQEPVYRVEPREEIESLVPESEPLLRSDATLRWVGPEGATYSLVVTTDRLKVLVNEQGLATSDYRLPEPALAGLEPGTVLFWHVEAALPDGSRLPSRTFRVQIE